MPAHLRQRGKKGTYWLIDGRLEKSLKTTVKRYADMLLDKYNKGKLDIGGGPTVLEYYERWIKTKQPPLVRKSASDGYRQQFSGYLLSEFGSILLATIHVGRLSAFRAKLLERGLSVKTCRNVLDASFRAMWRDAMAEGIVSHNPFELLRWPRMPREKPDPFTSSERDKIINWWKDNDFYYFPYVFVQFHTGMRPSEAAGLKWRDVDLENGIVSICRSSVMTRVGATKTKNSERIFPIGQEILDLLEYLPSKAVGLEHVFVNKFGRPMTKKWAEHNWAEPLRKLGIRHRKFYATRHTFITEAIRRGENPLAVAQYCGTSLEMIQRDYCGNLAMTVTTKIRQVESEGAKEKANVVAGPGFERLPITQFFSEIRRNEREARKRA